LAGEERRTSPHTTFIFHSVGFDMPAGERLEARFLRERLDGLLADQKWIANVIAERTGLNVEDVKGFFREAQTKDAVYAVGAGIAQEIRDVQAPPGAPLLSLGIPALVRRSRLASYCERKGRTSGYRPRERPDLSMIWPPSSSQETVRVFCFW
jgi:hypothetical protein